MTEWEGGRRPLTADEHARLVTFGRRLRELRSEAGLTQLQLALRAEMSTRHVGYLERGCRRPRESTVRRIVLAIQGIDPALDAALVEAELRHLAGTAVAEESEYRERVERRRRSRAKRHRRYPDLLESNHYYQLAPDWPNGLPGAITHVRGRMVRYDDSRTRETVRSTTYKWAFAGPFGISLSDGSMLELLPSQITVSGGSTPPSLKQKRQT